MAGTTVFVVPPVTRYPEGGGFSSARDPFRDLTVHLEFLVAADYATDLLTSVHGVSLSDAVPRAPSIRSHARLALHYIEQAEASRPEVSFLPCYYGILQLMKLYILFGPLHDRLKDNRTHGASYSPAGPPDRNFASDTITVNPKGSIALFYEALTGRTIPAPTSVRMDQLYPFMQDCSAEWAMASSVRSSILQLTPSVAPSTQPVWRVSGPLASDDLSIAQLPALTPCEPHPDIPGPMFRGLTPSPVDNMAGHLEATLDRTYLYFPLLGKTTTALMNGPLLMPEELPIALALFHLSSVVRYHPDYLEHLRDSRYWPVVVEARLHCLHKFLILLWSFLKQKHVNVTRD